MMLCAAGAIAGFLVGFQLSLRIRQAAEEFEQKQMLAHSQGRPTLRAPLSYRVWWFLGRY